MTDGFFLQNGGVILVNVCQSHMITLHNQRQLGESQIVITDTDCNITVIAISWSLCISIAFGNLFPPGATVISKATSC